MTGDHVLWLAIGILVGWLGIPLVLGFISGRQG